MSKELDELYDRYRMVDESVYRRDRRIVLWGLLGLFAWAVITFYVNMTTPVAKGDLDYPKSTTIYKSEP